MSIKHTFVSPKAEQSDPTLVGPNEWNANHTIDPATITYSMLQLVAANNVLLGNNAGAGQPAAELTAAQVKTLLAIASSDVSGLAAIATSGSASDLSAGTIPSGRMPALTGDVTTSAGSVATTIAANAVTNAKAAQMAANTIKGNNTAGLANAVDLTVAQTKALLAMAPADVTFAATQRVLGRNTAGGGTGEEVTASQILDWVSNANGVLLTRTGGSWAALANVGTDNGDLQFTENTAPVAPGSGKSKVFGASSGGRQMIASVAPAGAKMIAQPFLGQRNWAAIVPVWNSAAATTIGISVSATGTATAKSPGTASFYAACKRVQYLSGSVAGNVGGVHGGTLGYLRGDAAGKGGFHGVWRFAWSDAVFVSTGRGFAGLWGSGGAPTDVDPSTLTNIIGIGNDNGDTQMQLYASGSSAQAKTALGANFPANTSLTDVYELGLYCAPNDSKVTWEVTRLNTGDRTTGTISVAANLPSSTTQLAPHFWRSNGGTASAVAVDVMNWYLETDN